ncbi:MAG: hypothetical protein GY751_25040 [Bacteroidetes bacterium]|nr:hypothetical protein [Bacteroidota bacterium]
MAADVDTYCNLFRAVRSLNLEFIQENKNNSDPEIQFKVDQHKKQRAELKIALE